MGPGLRNAAFEQILKRPEATQAFLTALNEGKIKSSSLGPTDAARLRTHPNKQIATRANAMLDKLISPASKEKDAIIAKLTPEVEKPGNIANGKLMFTATCSLCHRLGDIGKDVAPPLTGMGAHGPAELLVSVVDPNREVDPSFFAWNITKKNGEILVGVIGSENQASLTLKTQTGDFEIRKDDIKVRENTHRSLMPEGFEALPPEILRDILAFICGDAAKQFRILHLADAYTADSREGVFKSAKPNGGVVRLAKFGNVNVNGIPFYIQDPAKSTAGANLIVLKGGPKDARSQSFPSKVEVPINVETKRLQLLSGISGWGYPAVKDQTVAVNATVVYASGEKESFALKNGVAFADYIRPVEVPGSQYVEGITDGQQMRLLTLKLTKKGVAKSLILESPGDNHTVPVIAAITADIEGKVDAKGKGAAPRSGDISVPAHVSGGKAAPTPLDATPKEGGKNDGPLLPATSPNWAPNKTKVLIIGGGSSHNFQKFFDESDSATLKAAGFSVHYTEDRDQAAAELKDADVALISVNRKFFDTPAYRKALMDFANSGKGLVMLHPGTWYGYADWPELNAKIVGGGARGHDAIDQFTVSVVKPDHPVMKGVPATFEATDELYYINAEPDKIPAGTAPIEVLAQTSPSKKFQKPHPSVWVTQHDKAKIVGIALGHDERVHDMEAFKAILVNSVRWVSQK
jgi:putative heme-binding domain-containing protein